MTCSSYMADFITMSTSNTLPDSLDLACLPRPALEHLCHSSLAKTRELQVQADKLSSTLLNTNRVVSRLRSQRDNLLDRISNASKREATGRQDADIVEDTCFSPQLKEKAISSQCPGTRCPGNNNKDYLAANGEAVKLIGDQVVKTEYHSDNVSTFDVASTAADSPDLSEIEMRIAATSDSSKTPRRPIIKRKTGRSQSARASRSKRSRGDSVALKAPFVMPSVARNLDGSPVLPIMVGAVTIINLGLISTDPRFSSRRCIFPIGHISTRQYSSFVTENGMATYTSSISAVDGDPSFRVVASDDPGRSFEASSATGVWTRVLAAVSSCKKRTLCRVSGIDYFGLNAPLIRALLQELPGADQLPQLLNLEYTEDTATSIKKGSVLAGSDSVMPALHNSHLFPASVPMPLIDYTPRPRSQSMQAFLPPLQHRLPPQAFEAVPLCNSTPANELAQVSHYQAAPPDDLAYNAFLANTMQASSDMLTDAMAPWHDPTLSLEPNLTELSAELDTFTKDWSDPLSYSPFQ